MPTSSTVQSVDIFLQSWGLVRAYLYTDLFVISPWYASSPPSLTFQVGHALTEHAWHKREQYSSALVAQQERVEFLPLGMEIFGGILPEALPLLRRVHRALLGALCPADIHRCVKLYLILRS